MDGATRDILLGRRDHEAAQKRGTWKTYSSFRCYEKSGRVQKGLAPMKPDTLMFTQLAARSLLHWLGGPSRTLPKPPTRLRWRSSG
mmetsp:Transcript_123627/g.357610  ORF Transcript_123627/g.357610 Transcript_123627/m.357610 type:complete len:86 (+) Transcript_123627:1051-1308(+)